MICLSPFNIFSSAFFNFAFDAGLHVYHLNDWAIFIILTY